MNPGHVYILGSDSGTLYVGVTSDSGGVAACAQDDPNLLTALQARAYAQDGRL